MSDESDIDEAEEQTLRDELCRRSLVDYVQLCFPDFKLSPWQIHLCVRLQAFIESIEQGKSPRLMVHVPPQCGKTTIVSRAFICWMAGRHPEWDGIMASYAQSMSRKNSRWVRNRLRSFEHWRIFPACNLAEDSQSIEDMNFTTGKQIISRGVGGGAAGNPAMWVVVDDPFADRKAADSPIVRENVDDWYTSTAIARLGPGAGVLIMHTRWHLDDLAGRLLKRAKDGKEDPNVDQWEVISYPAEWTPGAPKEFFTWEKIKETVKGWLTCRFRAIDLKRKKANLPSRDWLSLFQQTPLLEGGQIFQTKWINEETWPVNWKPVVYQAWDLAGTKQDLKNDGCYSVGIAIALDWLRRWWLVDLVRGKWDAGELNEQIMSFGLKWQKRGQLIRVSGEDPVALYLEPFLRERMRQSGKHIPFQRVNVGGRGDKVARAQASLVPVMSNGSFMVPKDAPWLPDLKEELTQFPQGYLDQVDALSLGFAESMAIAKESPPPTTTGRDLDPNKVTGDVLKTYQKHLADEEGRPQPRRRTW